MAREKFQTLTEQMFYILLSLREEGCGVDVMERVGTLSGGRIAVGPGTLYSLFDSFLGQEWIEETAVVGRRRSYRLTPAGAQVLHTEYERLQRQAEDYRRVMGLPGEEDAT